MTEEQTQAVEEPQAEKHLQQDLGELRKLFVIGLIGFLAIFAFGYWRYMPTPAKGDKIPKQAFSSKRAFATLKMLLGDGSPHPVGSKANYLVRDRILAYLKKLGYQPQIQKGTTKNYRGQTITVQNIMVRLKGTDSLKSKGKPQGKGGIKQTLLLASHYDSVFRGPGAGDAGASVASILEMARMMKAGKPPKHDVIFLLTDGEEAGLVGAIVFAKEHPWAKEVGIAINMEARGVSGPSLMFETSAQNHWLVQQYAQVTHRPIAGSLFEAVYKFLPNNTDFTIFRKAGMYGFNFAFIRDVRHYHTKNDDLKHLSRASLQHQGDNAWALVQRLSHIPWPKKIEGKTIYFDFFSLFLIWWPLSLTFWIFLFGAGCFAGGVFLLHKRGLIHFSSVLWGLGCVLLALLIGILFGVPVDVILHKTKMVTLRHPWTESVTWAWHLLFWAFGFGALFLAQKILKKRLDFWGIWTAVWLLGMLFSLLLVLKLPTASYLFLVPSLFAGMMGLVCGVLHQKVDDSELMKLAIVPAFVTACFLLPAEILFYDGLQLTLGTLTTVRAIGVLVTLAPFGLGWMQKTQEG